LVFFQGLIINFIIFRLKKQVNILKTDLKFVKQNFKDLPIQNHHFYELMQHQIIRIATLGVTGFDSPVAFNSVEEAIEKVKSLDSKQMLELFKRGNKALWERNTAYHEWNKILPLIDPDYREVDITKLVKQYHSEFIHYEH
jgi:hypothetical protein